MDMISHRTASSTLIWKLVKNVDSLPFLSPLPSLLLNQKGRGTQESAFYQALKETLIGEKVEEPLRGTESQRASDLPQ
jgi:hypothetical protein